jgi:hypothetical protein
MIPAMGNVMINFTAMIVGTIFFNFNPILFFVTLCVGHLAIAGYASRDPHIATLISAWLITRRKTSNLIKSKGNKYVP